MLRFKQFMLQEQKLKAEDYEAAIVIGWHNNNKKKLDVSSSGISSKVYDMLQNNKSAIQTGELIANAIAKKFGNKNAKAEQYGRAKSKLTPFWKSYGATDTTPKTDILIGDKRISLKIGLAQLMSGGKAESTATFQAAVKNSNPDLVKSPQYKKTTQVLEGFVKNTLAPSQLRPLIKSGTDKVVNAAEKAHKDCMSELGKLFNESESFKVEFAKEAMSGYEKFGKNSPASADLMLVATADGGKTAIQDVNDDAYCLKIANAMRLQARFKTSSRKIKGVKTGEYNYWSVVSLIVNSMSEELESGEKEMLIEINILNKVKSFVSKTWSKVTNFFKKGLKQLTSFLGAIPDIRVRRNVKF